MHFSEVKHHGRPGHWTDRRFELHYSMDWATKDRSRMKHILWTYGKICWWQWMYIYIPCSLDLALWVFQCTVLYWKTTPDLAAGDHFEDTVWVPVTISKHNLNWLQKLFRTKISPIQAYWWVTKCIWLHVQHRYLHTFHPNQVNGTAEK